MKKRCFLCLLILLFSCTGKVPFRVGKNYILDNRVSGYFYLVNNQNTFIIDRDITKFDFDSIYIIAKQKPIDEIWKKTNVSGMTYEKRRAIFKKSTLYYYWIINKKRDYIYGPLTKERYQELKDSLSIHLELKNMHERIRMKR